MKLIIDIDEKLNINSDNIQVQIRLDNRTKTYKEKSNLQSIIKEWRMANPTEKKVQCYKDTKISRPTIDKYWDCLGED